MTATPALTPDIFGKYQQRISNDLYLDHKESEGVLVELRAFAAELLAQAEQGYSNYNTDHTIITNSDPGDEHV
jgi:hypothetical protein